MPAEKAMSSVTEFVNEALFGLTVTDQRTSHERSTIGTNSSTLTVAEVISLWSSCCCLQYPFCTFTLQDVKPSNLVAPGGYLRIIDFDSNSSGADADGRYTANAGSPDFMVLFIVYIATVFFTAL